MPYMWNYYLQGALAARRGEHTINPYNYGYGPAEAWDNGYYVTKYGGYCA